SGPSFVSTVIENITIDRVLIESITVDGVHLNWELSSLEETDEISNYSIMEQNGLLLGEGGSKNERRSSIGSLRSERRRHAGRSAASSLSVTPTGSVGSVGSLGMPATNEIMFEGVSDSPPYCDHIPSNRCTQIVQKLPSPDSLAAAANGDELRVSILLNLYHVDVSYKDSKGNSAIHYATEYGHLKVIICLIEHGAKITDRDQDGMTLLHIAAKYDHMHIIHYLIREHNSNVYCFDHYNRTPFFVACMYNHLEIAQYLLTTLLKYATLEQIIN
ncbi:MAG: ankyrin repeat domain-containing protein, partial [Proteobacteria bacterium]|nr:ankyrin repeat domain-containing protein [Pseudomonadota bacterium]